MASYSTISANSPGMAGESSTGSHRGRRRASSKLLKTAAIGSASWIGSVLNLVNTIIGAGTLAMPLAMSHMGILLGTMFIIWSALTAGFGLYLQTRCARYLDRGSASFFALSQMTFPNLAVFLDAAIVLKCFGVAVSYLIIIGDLMPKVVEGFYATPEYAYLVDRHFWITAFMLVVIPLSFPRKLDSLKFTSAIALMAIGYLVVLVVYHFAEGDTKADRGDIRVIEWGGAVPFLSSVPVIVFAYTCHQNMFSILNELKDNSHYKTTALIGTSIGSAAGVYILVAITGYLSFGNEVAGNIIGMYAPSIASTIGKAAIVILVMFSYPLQVNPCRASVDAVLKWRPVRTSTSNPARTGPNASPTRVAPLIPRPAAISSPADIPETRFACITSVIVLLSYLTAMSVSSLETVLAYVGATGSTSISFILPGLFYYKISAPDSFLHQRLAKEDDDSDSDDEVEDGLLGQGMGRSSWRKKILRQMALALAIYGVVVMVVCLVCNTFLVAAH